VAKNANGKLVYKHLPGESSSSHVTSHAEEGRRLGRQMCPYRQNLLGAQATATQ